MDINNYYLLFIIVDFGKATKVIHVAKNLGATGGTIFLGTGTVRSNILSLLGLNESRKEIIVMGVENDLEGHIHKELEEKFHMEKPNHGIIFSIPLKEIVEIKSGKENLKTGKEGGFKVEYEAILTIVNKGEADKVIEAANKAGSTGGTIIHGRGSGTEKTEKLFNIEIEPEKDIILILSNIEKTETIVGSIKKSIGAQEEGKGIIFVMDVSRTTGLYKGK